MTGIGSISAASRGGKRSGGTPGKGPRGSNGQGANSALAEMLRQQARNPRPGGVQQPPRDARDLREPGPQAPRKSRG